MSFVPSFLNEWNDHPVTDCVPASGVMLANKITHNRYPATVAEREALQNAMGTQDEGANAVQLVAGMLKRYGLRLSPNAGGWPTIAAALADPLSGVALFGKYELLPAALRNQGLQPGFSGGHCVYYQAGLLGDPLGTHFIAAKVSDVAAFSQSFNGMAVIAREQPATFVNYKLIVPAGILTFYRVARFTHTLYGAKPTRFSRQSWAPLAGTLDKHGAPGFWMVTAGELSGYYAVFGRSGTFSVQAIYSDGSSKPVNPAS